MAKPNHAQPAKPGLPPLRTPTPRTRVSVTRVQLVQSAQSQSTHSSPKGPEHRYEAQRRWFDHEVRTLRRLAQTERLAGDYVAAQRLERELDSFIKEASALMEQEGPR